MLEFFTDRTPPTRTELAARYDSFAPTWLRRESRAEGKLVSNAWRNDLVKNLEGDVLEVGVAAGDTLLRLPEYGQAVTSFTGIDISPEMIEESKCAAEGLGVPVSLYVGDAQALSHFPDSSFDTVTASLVFCTIPDVPQALSEVARVCKPDGKIVMIEHVLSPNQIVARLQKLVAPIQIRHMGCHLDRTTVETLQENGFRIREHRRRLFGVMRFLIADPPE